MSEKKYFHTMAIFIVIMALASAGLLITGILLVTNLLQAGGELQYLLSTMAILTGFIIPMAIPSKKRHR